MSQQKKQEPLVISRDQDTINNYNTGLETALEYFNDMIEQASKVEVKATADNWVNILNNPEKFTKELITAKIPDQTIGGFKVKRSALIAELELPNLSGLIISANKLRNHLINWQLPVNLLEVINGQAVINQTEYKILIDHFTVKANDVELYDLLNALGESLNNLNKLLSSRGRTPINPNFPRPLQNYFTLELSGALKINPVKYQELAQ